MSEQANRNYPLPVAQPDLATLVPCSHGFGCPLGVDAPAIVSAVLAGDQERAYRLARGPNPFASSCGHGCHAPCETACRRRQHGAPVAIASLEAYAGGFGSALASVLASSEPCTSAHDARSVAGLVRQSLNGVAHTPRSGRRVAIVGGGAAGLACAHDLMLLGHACTIFDARSEPGGLLTGALPAFRFPVDGARAECAAILQMGVEFRAGCRIEGTDALRSLLADGYDAVFLAIGASAPNECALPGRPSGPDVLDAMTVLTSDVAVQGRVVVIGDGDLALDAARVLSRRARTSHNMADAPEGTPRTGVEVVLQSPLEASTLSTSMIAGALQDGVAFHAGWRVERLVIDRERGTVAGVLIARPGQRSKKLLNGDRIVLASPRAPSLSAFGAELARDDRGFILVDQDTMRTSMSGVWAGGACVAGHRSIAHATADGKRAGWQIHAALTGMPVRTRLSSAWVEVEHWDGERSDRAIAARRTEPSAEQVAPPSTSSDRTPPEALPVSQEASRCFDCTVLPVIDSSCTTCGKCVSACPTSSFSLRPGPPRRLLFDQNLCYRCGACVHECPEGSIAMVRAVWEERLVRLDSERA